MKREPSFRAVAARRAFVVGFVALAAALAPVLAADVTRPSEVAGLAALRTSPDVTLSWGAVTLDIAGQPETVNHYNVYRGTTPGFVPDRAGGSNRIGTPALANFTDTGAASNGSNYYYLVTAVDAAGNESGTKPATVTTPPVLSGNWTETTIDLTWTNAQPVAQVQKYRVYYGRASHVYDSYNEVGLATSASLTLAVNTMWYLAVTAIDVNGNESAFSNEWVDVVAGRITLRAHDDDYLCWGAGGCPPKPGRIQRSDGWEIMAPIDFPPGPWTKINVTYTLDSRLCKVGQHGTTDKCGGTNPGGYNPCGDPWDRTAHLYLVLDDCLEGTGSCVTNRNLELIRAITPFGTDAPAPDGDGVVPPRVLTLDVTPYRPLLTGHRYVGANIGMYVQAGWHVTSEFYFSKRPDEISPKRPADGVQVLFFQGSPPPTATVTIPADATKVITRLFTTGHGGTLYCDGGSKDGNTCASNADCPGGSCQNCDEFCHRTNQILVNGAVAYSVVPWRTDCSPGVTGCTKWNACGFPSCTFSRAGWCPGYIACTSNKAAGCDQDIDMTAKFPPGSTDTVDYNVLVQRGSWTVSLVLYWYR